MPEQARGNANLYMICFPKVKEMFCTLRWVFVCTLIGESICSLIMFSALDISALVHSSFGTDTVKVMESGRRSGQEGGGEKRQKGSERDRKREKENLTCNASVCYTKLKRN